MQVRREFSGYNLFDGNISFGGGKKSLAGVLTLRSSGLDEVVCLSSWMWTMNLDNKHGDGTCLIVNIIFILSFSASE